MSAWLKGHAGTGYRLLPGDTTPEPRSARSAKVQPADGPDRTRTSTEQRSRTAGDIVQFMSHIFYTEEGRKHQVSVKVIRIGTLEGECSVSCQTQDSTAKAGEKYQHLESVLRFGPGEAMRSFDIELIDDDNFDTTLDFRVFLSNPDGCAISSDQSMCQVLIFDNDLFPSSDFHEHLHDMSKVREEDLHKIGFRLLWAFMRFTFRHVPTIWWKSIVAVFLAQLGNAYYLMTIYLKVYLVDVCLNVKDDSTLERLLVPGSRGLTAAVLGLCWVLPNFILVAADHFDMSVLEMGFHIRQHLRVNLFRKYLNYTRNSRLRVPIQDLKTSMMEDIPTLARDGYLISFEILKKVCKVVCVGYWLLKKHPRSGIPLAIYPTLMLLWLGSRYKRRLWLLKKTGDGGSDTQGWLLHADASYDLVNDYGNRNAIVGKFQQVLQDQRKLVMALKSFSFWSGIIIPWITIIATGFYIAAAGKLVTEGELSLGSFLATINLYKDLGDRFDGIYADFEALSEVIDPLSVLTVQFNLETDLPQRMEAHEAHEQYLEKFLAEESTSQVPATLAESVYDTVPIFIKDVVIRTAQTPPAGVCFKPDAYREEGEGADYPTGPRLSMPLSASAQQGCLICVSGEAGCGKTGLLSMITKDCMPTSGEVCLPPHLRIVRVSSQPSFVKSMGLYANLVFGVFSSEGYHAYTNPERVGQILRRLSLHHSWIYHAVMEDCAKAEDELSPEHHEHADDEDIFQEMELALREDDEAAVPLEDVALESDVEQDHLTHWYDCLSKSEAKRLHLARAFIASPEVLVMHAPLDNLDVDLAKDVLQMMREFVDERGIALDPQTKHCRRKRSLFFSSTDAQMSRGIADFTCTLGRDTVSLNLEPRVQSSGQGWLWTCGDGG